MPSYRVYHLDGEGKIASAEWLEAADDAEAAHLAASIDANGPLEVWDRNRFVVRIDPGSKTPS